MKFRMINEGEGGTLPIDVAPSRVGTFFLMTCVAVYFRVSESKCFFAHIDARSAEMEDHAMVIKQAGEEIAKQVRLRLRDHLQADKWDIHDPFFGQDLTIEAPCHRDQEYNGRKYQTPARYVVQGIREFFSACSQVLDEEAEGSERSTPKAKPQDPAVIEHQHAVIKLRDKARFLDHQAQHPDMDDKHHILIVEPANEAAEKKHKVIRLGKVRDPSRSAIPEDLDTHVYEYGQSLGWEKWCLGVLEDDRLAFPKNKLSTDEQRAVRVKELERASERWKRFGGEPTDRLLRRLTKLLERK